MHEWRQQLARTDVLPHSAWALILAIAALTIAGCDSVTEVPPAPPGDAEVTVQGTILDESEQTAIEGATVQVYRPEDRNPIATSSSAANGTYKVSAQISDADLPDTLRIQATAEGYGAETHVVAFEEEVDLDLMLVSGEAAFAGGAGSESDPYQIETVEQLQDVNRFLTSHFVQTADVDASETANWNEGRGFTPIGYWKDPEGRQPFVGSFDGDGHRITNLTIERTGDSPTGLFEAVGEEGQLTNITLQGADISGADLVGGLTGVNAGEIDASTVGGALTGNERVGGLAGLNDTQGDIRSSHAAAQIEGPEDVVGGLVGFNSGRVQSSHAAGDVNAEDSDIGGLVGFNWEGAEIIDSYATGDVDGEKRRIGGLVGLNEGEIRGSHAEGTVTGYGKIGGLVGYHSGEVHGSHASGSVEGEDEVFGGLVGLNRDGSIHASHATGNVQGGQEVAGGLVGANYGDIEDARAEGTVATLQSTAGGLVGFNHGEIAESEATGDVSTEQDVGGLVGLNFRGTITESSAAGDVTAADNIPGSLSQERAGGLVGHNDDGTVDASYAEGHAEGVREIGGLVGVNRAGTIRDSYATGSVASDEYEDPPPPPAFDPTMEDHTVGGLVGINRANGAIHDSHATGSVESGDFAGGLVGDNQGGTIIGSHATGPITGAQSDLGGLVGRNTAGGVVYASYAEGSVEGDTVFRNLRIGGLVGSNIESEVHKSWATGAVTGEVEVGGLVGSDSSGTVEASFTTARVSGDEDVGGLVGRTQDSSEIQEAYAAGPLTGTEYVGGVVGRDESSTSHATYWDIEESGVNEPAGAGEADGMRGLTTMEMTGTRAPENMNLDFDDTWQPTTGDYPKLYLE